MPEHKVGDLVMYKSIDNEVSPPTLGTINKISEKWHWREKRKIIVYYVDWCDEFHDPDAYYMDHEIKELKLNLEKYKKNING